MVDTRPYEIDTSDYKIVKRREDGENSIEVVYLDGDEVIYSQVTTYSTHSGLATYNVIYRFPTKFDPNVFRERIDEIEEMMEDDEPDELAIYEAVEKLFDEVVSEVYTEEDIFNEVENVVRDAFKLRFGRDCESYDAEIRYQYYDDIIVEGTCDGIPFHVSIAKFNNILGDEVYEYYLPDMDDVEFDEEPV